MSFSYHTLIAGSHSHFPLQTDASNDTGTDGAPQNTPTFSTADGPGRGYPLCTNFSVASLESIVTSANALWTPGAGNPYSAVMWIRPTGTQSSTGFAFSEGVGSTNNPYIGLRVATDRNLRFRVIEGNSGGAGSTNDIDMGTVSVDTWYHVAMTIGSASEQNAYLNSSAATGGTISHYGSALSSNQVGIAMLFRTGQSNFFNGDMAGVAMFDYELSQAQVNALYAGPEPIATIDPTAELNGTSLVVTPGAWNTYDNGSLSLVVDILRNGVEVATDQALSDSGTTAYDLSSYGDGTFTARVKASNNADANALYYKLTEGVSFISRSFNKAGITVMTSPYSRLSLPSSSVTNTSTDLSTSIQYKTIN